MVWRSVQHVAGRCLEHIGRERLVLFPGAHTPLPILPEFPLLILSIVMGQGN